MWAADMWRTVSRRLGDPSELDATKTMLNILDLAVAESTSLESLSGRLSNGSFNHAQGVGSDAAALAIESGDFRLGVSLLEQGRSIIYAQLGRFRSAIDDIRKASSELAERLAGLSMELDALVVRGERVDSKINVQTKRSDDNFSR